MRHSKSIVQHAETVTNGLTNSNNCLIQIVFYFTFT